MSDLNDPPLYTSVTKDNRPHSFTGLYVAICFERLYTWKQHRLDTEYQSVGLTTILPNFLLKKRGI